MDRLTGTDADGSKVSIASVRLSFDADDAEALADAEFAIRDIVRDSQGPLKGSSLSPAVINDEASGGLRVGDAGADGHSAGSDCGGPAGVHPLAL